MLTAMSGSRELFATFELARPSALTECGRVNAVNAADARYYVDEAGRRWVGKRELDTGVESVLAESLCWFLAKETGVRTPEAGCIGDIATDSFVWLSEYVGNTVHWESRHANFIANDGEVVAMLVLDAVTFNEDRHALNVLLVPQAETVLQLWAIDSGNARVGYIDDFCRLSSDSVPPVNDRTLRGLPIARLRGLAELAAHPFEELARDRPATVEHYVRVACDLVHDGPRAASLSAALTARMANARSLITSYLDALEARP